MPQAAPTQDFLADARGRMVDSQLRPNKVNDPRILDSMRYLPRERFLPPGLAAQAYADQNIDLGSGRVLMQPMALARLVQAADLRRGDKVLIVGANTGYSAALLASLGCDVVALEEPGAMADQARHVLAELAPGVSCVSGLLAAGWTAAAPYDAILIDGTVPAIPVVLAGQAKPDTGRVLAIIGGTGRPGYAAEALPAAGGVSVRALFDAAVPVIPAFAPAPAFAF